MGYFMIIAIAQAAHPTGAGPQAEQKFQNVKAASRGIAMSSSQFSHALERGGDANT
jgi:hypothetical protein